MADTPPDDETVQENRLTAREAEVLPIWAQERMAQLRWDASRAEAQYSKQFDSQEPTGIAYGDVYNNPRYLPDNPFDTIHVSLHTPEERATVDQMVDNYLQLVRKTKGWDQRAYLEVTASDTIIIEPQASNTIRLRVLRDADIQEPS